MLSATVTPLSQLPTAHPASELRPIELRSTAVTLPPRTGSRA